MHICTYVVGMSRGMSILLHTWALPRAIGIGHMCVTQSDTCPTQIDVVDCVRWHSLALEMEVRDNSVLQLGYLGALSRVLSKADGWRFLERGSREAPKRSRV